MSKGTSTRLHCAGSGAFVQARQSVKLSQSFAGGFKVNILFSSSVKAAGVLLTTGSSISFCRGTSDPDMPFQISPTLRMGKVNN
jgi:hypothetical protein